MANKKQQSGAGTGEKLVLPENYLLTPAELGLADGADGEVLDGNGEFTVYEVEIDDIELGINVRDIDWDHVRNLSESIRVQKQLQECVGDRRKDGTVRVWAGQHRYWAVKMLNDSYIQAGRPDLCRTLRVRVYEKELNDDQILAIQIAENLHNKMDPEEEAEVIRDLWVYYQKVHKLNTQDDEKKTEAAKAHLAAKIGRSPSKVYSALKYAELAPEVKRLVIEDFLTYTQSLSVARLTTEAQQVSAANHLVLEGSQRMAQKYIEGLLLDMEKAKKELTLFTREVDDELKLAGKKLSLQKAAGRQATSAIKYFQSLVYLFSSDSLSEEHIALTDSLSLLIFQYITSASDLLDWLWERDPELGKAFQALVINYEEERKKVYYSQKPSESPSEGAEGEDSEQSEE